ncbi:hypothetical protein IFM89_020302 [Coptis chinensis]|uniref:Uncharacterized protein n=1 Tax=Coptis chinensis TaxID=261450 RepID=A0A835LQU5_9MAGN|nr:hypothetical protein IFM89_020302 [Coptis chinensis]
MLTPQQENPPTLVRVENNRKTSLQHVVFGIAASAKFWEKRKKYIKLWWKPNEMRGFVWLDKQVKTHAGETDILPPLKISADIERFPYKNRLGDPSAIRISRIVSETVRLGLKDVRWLNIDFSYNMAYGGGGFAISYGLAKEIEKMQDTCIQRYPQLYGSDDRMQACMAEVGVPLTKEAGFHQFDVYGSALGLLAAHPVAPLVSMHHLDIVDPIFPNMTQVQGLSHLNIPIELDSASMMQQSMCYDKNKIWSISTSWGYVVQIYRGFISPRELERPSRTFLNWYRQADQTGFSFNTRPVSRNGCQTPFTYYMSKAWYDSYKNQMVTEYVRHWTKNPHCRWKILDPGVVDQVVVYKRPDPQKWEKAPRRNCCRILPSRNQRIMLVEVSLCREGETIGI